MTQQQKQSIQADISTETVAVKHSGMSRIQRCKDNAHRYFYFLNGKLRTFTTHEKDFLNSLASMFGSLNASFAVNPSAFFRSATAVAMSGLLLLPNVVSALPTGLKSVSGNVTATKNGNTLNVDATRANRTIAEWQTFNIARNETVNINQMSANSAHLSRVVGGSPSAIFGALNSNGQVFLVNTAGILFGAGSQINVGSLTASTLDINNQNFLNNNLVFQRTPGQRPGSVVNEGTIITSDGGYVSLIGGAVRNTGRVVAPNGFVSMAVGDKVTMAVRDGVLVDVTVDEALSEKADDLSEAISNTGYLSAEAVKLQAELTTDFYQKAINNTGIVRAYGATGDGGKIELVAKGTSNLLVNVGGTLDASAEGANNDAGTVYVWSDGTTDADGRLLASGGSESGDAGFIEVSAKEVVNFMAIETDLTANNGEAGTLLIDPTNATVNAAAAAAATGNFIVQADNNITFTNGDAALTDIDFNNGGLASARFEAGDDIRLRDNVIFHGQDSEFLGDFDENGDGRFRMTDGASLSTGGGDTTIQAGHRFNIHNGGGIDAGTGEVTIQTTGNHNIRLDNTDTHDGGDTKLDISNNELGMISASTVKFKGFDAVNVQGPVDVSANGYDVELEGNRFNINDDLDLGTQDLTVTLGSDKTFTVGTGAITESDLPNAIADLTADELANITAGKVTIDASNATSNGVKVAEGVNLDFDLEIQSGEDVDFVNTFTAVTLNDNTLTATAADDISTGSGNIGGGAGSELNLTAEQQFLGGSGDIDVDTVAITANNTDGLGTGISLQGDVNGDTSVTLTSAGNVQSLGTISGGALSVTTTATGLGDGDFTGNSPANTNVSEITLNVAGDAEINNNQAVTVHAGSVGGNLELTNAGSIDVDGDVSIGDELDLTANSGGDVTIDGNVTSVNDAAVTADGNVDVNDHLESTAGSVTINAGGNVTNGVVAPPLPPAFSIIAAGNISIVSGGDVTNNSTLQSTGGSVSVTADGAIDNQAGGNVSAATSVTLVSDNDDSGSTADDITNAGSITGATVSIDAGDDFSNSTGGSSVEATAGDLSIQTGDDFNNSGSLTASNDVLLDLDDDVNQNHGSITAGNDIIANVAEQFRNNGSMSANNDITINNGELFENRTAGSITADADGDGVGDVSIDNNNGNEQYDVNNRGSIQGANVTIDADDDFKNQNSGSVTATHGNVSISADEDLENDAAATITASGNVTLAAATEDVTNEGTVTAGGNVDIDAGEDFHNDGTVTATGDVDIDVTDDMFGTGQVNGDVIDLNAGDRISGIEDGVNRFRVDANTLIVNTGTERANIREANSVNLDTSSTGTHLNLLAVDSITVVGDVTAGTSVLLRTLNGDITTNAGTTIDAGRDVRFNSGDNIVNDGHVDADRHVDFDAANNISNSGNSIVAAGNVDLDGLHITNTGLIDAGGNITGNARGRITNTATGNIDADGDVVLTTDTNSTGSSNDDIDNSGNISGATVTLDSGDDVINASGATVDADGGDVTINAGRTNGDGDVDNDGTITATANIDIDASDDVDNDGHIETTGGNIDIDAGGDISNSGNSLVATGDIDMDGLHITNTGLIDAGGNITGNARGRITNTATGNMDADGNVALTSDTNSTGHSNDDIDNSGNISGATVTLDAGDDVINASGATVDADGGDVTINAGRTNGDGDVDNDGTITATANIDIDASDDVDNDGHIETTGGNIDIDAGGDIFNSGNSLVATGNIDMDAGGNIDNDGLIDAGGNITGNAGGSINNRSTGNMDAEGDVALTSDTDNSGSSADDIINRGRIHGANVSLDAGDDVRNLSTGAGGVNRAVIDADGGNVTINAGRNNSDGDASNQGDITATGNITIGANDDVSNGTADTIIAGGNVNITTDTNNSGGSADFDNSGTIQGQNVTVDSGDDIRNNTAASTIEATNGDVILNAGRNVSHGDILNNGNITATGAADLDATQNIHGSGLTTADYVELTAGGVIAGTSAGTGRFNINARIATINAGGVASINETDSITLIGANTAGGNFDLLAGEDIITIPGSSVIALGDVIFNAVRDVDNNGHVEGQNIFVTAGRDILNSGFSFVANNGNATLDAGGKIENVGLVSATNNVTGTADGHIFNSGSMIADSDGDGSGDLTLTSDVANDGGFDDITNRGVMRGANVTLTAGDDIRNELAGNIESTHGDVTLNAQGNGAANGDIVNNAIITAAANIDADAERDIDNNGNMTAGGNIDADAGRDIDNDGFMTAGGTADLNAGEDITGDGLLTADHINLLAARFIARDVTTGGFPFFTTNPTGRLNINGNTLTANGNDIALNETDSITLVGSSHANGTRGIFATQRGRFDLLAGTDITVANGASVTGRYLVRFNAGRDVTNHGTVLASGGPGFIFPTGGTVDIDAGRHILNSTTGHIQANRVGFFIFSNGGNINLDAGGNITNNGNNSIIAGGNIVANADGRFDNTGNINADGDVTITSDVDNSGSSDDDVRNTGTIHGANVTISAGDDVENDNGGVIEADGGNVSLTARRDDVDIDNASSVTATGNITTNSADDTRVDDDSIIAAGGNLNVTADDDIRVEDRSHLSGTNVTLDATGTSHSDIDVDDDSTVTATGGDVVLNARDDVRITDRSHVSGRNATVTAGGTGNNDLTIDDDSSVTATAGDATLSAGDNILIDDRSTVSATGNVSITNVGTTSDSDIEIDDDSVITAGGNVTISAEDDVEITDRSSVTGQNVTVTSRTDDVEVVDNSSVTATAGNVTLTGADHVHIHDSSTVSATNNVTLTAQGALGHSDSDVEITGSTVTAGNDVTATAADDVHVNGSSTVTGGNDVNLTATGDDVNVTSGSTVTATNNNVNMNAADDIDIDGHVQAGNDINATAADDVENSGFSMVAANDINVNAGDNFENDGLVDAGRNVNITAGRDSDNDGTIRAGGNVDINAGRDIIGDGHTSGDFINLTAGRFIAQDVTTGGFPFFITSPTGRYHINGNSLTANAQSVSILEDDSVTLVGDSTATGGGGFPFGTPGNFDLLAGTDIFGANGASVDAASLLKLDAGRNIVNRAALRGGNVDIDAGRTVRNRNNGSIIADSVFFGLFGGNVDIDAGRNVVNQGNGLIQGRDIEITAGRHIRNRGNASINGVAGGIFTSGDVDLTAGRDVENLGNASITSADDVTMTAGRDINTSVNSTVTADDDIRGTAGRDINNDGTLDAGDDVTLTAGNDINNTSPDTINAGDDVTMTAGNDINNTGNITAGDTVTMTAGNDVTNTGNGLIRGNNAVNIIAGKDTINGVDASISAPGTKAKAKAKAKLAPGNVNITAGNDINNDGTITANNDVTLDAGNDVNNTSSDTIEAGDDVNITAGNNINNNGAITAGDEANLLAGNNITDNGAGLITAPNVNLEAGNDIGAPGAGINTNANFLSSHAGGSSTVLEVDDVRVVGGTAGDDWALIAGGNINTDGRVDAGNDVLLGSTGGGNIAINDTVRAGNSLFLLTNGAGNVRTATGAEISSTSLFARSGTGDINLFGDTLFFSAATAGNVNYLDKTGVIIDTPGRINGFGNVSGNRVNIRAGNGNIVTLGRVQGETFVQLNAPNGSILDGDVTGNVDVITRSGSAFLRAGNIIGTFENPLEVVIRGGQGFVNAGGAFQGNSVVMQGIVSPTLDPEFPLGVLTRLNDPPGLVIFNGVIFFPEQLEGVTIGFADNGVVLSQLLEAEAAGGNFSNAPASVENLNQALNALNFLLIEGNEEDGFDFRLVEVDEDGGNCEAQDADGNCVSTPGNQGSSLPLDIFTDGFESGDTSVWSTTSP